MVDPLKAQVEGLLPELSRFCRWLMPEWKVDGTDDDEDCEGPGLLLYRVGLHLAGAGDAPRSGPRELRIWAFRAVRAAHVEYARQDASRRRFVLLPGGRDDLPAATGPMPPVPRGALPADLVKALAALPEVARTTLLLLDLWDFRAEDAARILEESEDTVKARAARARVRLAALLAKGGAVRKKKR